jgi:ribosomal protein S27E
MTKHEFINKLKLSDKDNFNFHLLPDNINTSKDVVSIKCEVCGNITTKHAKDLLRIKKCPYCSKTSVKLIKDIVRKYCVKNPTIISKSGHLTTNDYVKIQCPLHGDLTIKVKKIKYGIKPRVCNYCIHNTYKKVEKWVVENVLPLINSI